MSKTNPTDQAGDELDEIVEGVVHWAVMFYEEELRRDAEQTGIPFTPIVWPKTKQIPMAKAKARLRRHYLPKRDVAEAIGPQLDPDEVVRNLPIGAKPNFGLQREIIACNSLKQSIRHRLGLEQVSNEEEVR